MATPNVLLIEDNLLTQRWLEKTLVDFGYPVSAFAEGKPALEAYRHNDFPIVLLDLVLPDIDGLAICRALRNLSQKSPSVILVMTALDEGLDHLPAVLEAGADDYLAKPIDPNLLKIRMTLAETHAQIRQKQQEDEAHLQLLKEAIETIELGVTITDLNQTIIYVNPMEARMHGYTVAELIGKSAKIFAGPSAVQRSDFEITKPLSNWRRESVNVRKDGSTFPVQLISTTVQNAQGEPIALITISEDITERKATENALKTMNDELEKKVAERTSDLYDALKKEQELHQLKSRFITMVSHEFRTPLTAIGSSSELLESFGDQMSPEQRQKRYDKIRAAIQHMTCMLEDVLNTGRLEANSIQFNPEPLNLDQFALDLLQSERQLDLQKQRIDFHTNGSSRRYWLDKWLLEVIIRNLLSNAIKYTPADKAIRFTITYTDEDIRLMVADEGPGIPEADQAHIFDPFYRAKPVENIPGTGLGLFMVHRAVQLHGGTIHLESNITQGTVITVHIPILYQAKVG